MSARMWTFHKLFCFLFTTLFIEASGGETILVSHNHGILRLEVGGKTNSSVVSADRPVVAFDIHRRWRQLFWATASTIYRTPIYDLETTTPLAEVGRVGSLAVDWVHHQLYWTDLSSGGGRVEAANLDGRRRRVVHRLGGSSHMGAMVLDPLLGKLFWIEWDDGKDNITRIMTCNLDGFAKKTFYESEFIPRDSPLAVDVTYNGIYFYKVTDNSSELWDANYQILVNGTMLYARTEEPPKSLALAKDGFYFSNNKGTYSNKWVKSNYTFVYGNRTDHIFTLNPYFRLLDSNLKNSSQIRVVSEVTQPQWPDQCAYHQCEHGCVVTSHQFHQHNHQQQQDHLLNTLCVCRYGYKLRADGRTCEERGYLIYSSGRTFGRITPMGEDNILLYDDSSANIQTFDVDVYSQHIYWSDLITRSIYRAPIEQLSRKEVLVADVTAYGLAVDWLHGNVYWTEQTRILVVPVKGGGGPLVVLDELDSPAYIAVDPIEKYIFWVECGNILSIKRANLDGSGVMMLVASYVTCGMSLTADHDTRTLFILDWAGAVSLCRYNGSGHTKLYSDVVRGVAIIDHQPRWTVIDYSNDDAPEDVDAFFPNQLNVLAHDLQPSMVKVVKTSHQPVGTNVCAEMKCEGVCLPTKESEVPRCVCPGDDNKMTSCPRGSRTNKGRNPNDVLDVVAITPFSITLQCIGPLAKRKMIRPAVHVEEVDSLVPRTAANRWKDVVHIDDLNLPFSVDGLNPATTYRLTVRHGVTRASRSITVHTPPPPLTLRRLPLVTVPGIPGEVAWEVQGVHYTTENPWEHLVTRKYFLLLLSNTTYTQYDSPAIPQGVQDVLKHQIKSSFIVLNSYMSEEGFDDDPEMYLANVLWGETFLLAMVQATEYKGSYNLDMVYSESFALPDPYWRPFVDDILEDQEFIDSIERL